MKAKTIKVSRLKAGPEKFENERIEIEVDVPDNCTAGRAVAACRRFIAQQFGEIPDRDELYDLRRELEEQLQLPEIE